jgi:hypothetical protein
MEYETAVQYLYVLIMPLPKPSVITIAGQNLGTGRIGAPLKSKDGGISLDRIRPTRPLPRLFLSMTLDTEHFSASAKCLIWLEGMEQTCCPVILLSSLVAGETDLHETKL